MPATVIVENLSGDGTVVTQVTAVRFRSDDNPAVDTNAPLALPPDVEAVFTAAITGNPSPQTVAIEPQVSAFTPGDYAILEPGTLRQEVIQVQSTAVQASLNVALGDGYSLLFTAVTAGTAGNSLQVQLANQMIGSGEPTSGVSLSVTLNADQLSIIGGTDGDGNLTSTGQDIIDAFNAASGVSALFTLHVTAPGLDTVVPISNAFSGDVDGYSAGFVSLGGGMEPNANAIEAIFQVSHPIGSKLIKVFASFTKILRLNATTKPGNSISNVRFYRSEKLSFGVFDQFQVIGSFAPNSNVPIASTESVISAPVPDTPTTILSGPVTSAGPLSSAMVQLQWLYTARAFPANMTIEQAQKLLELHPSYYKWRWAES